MMRLVVVFKVTVCVWQVAKAQTTELKLNINRLFAIHVVMCSAGLSHKINKNDCR